MRRAITLACVRNVDGRFVEYSAAGDDYLRMSYKVMGSRNQALVQLEAKKVKVRGCVPSITHAAQGRYPSYRYLIVDVPGAPRPSQRVVLADNRHEAESSMLIKPEQ